MYCGSCLRDNALASALIARGHDVVLTPIYTPTTTDEPNQSASRVFFGGVSVFLEQHVPLFRYTPSFLDQVWDSNAVLRLASKRQIKVDPAVLGKMTVSMLKGVAGFQKKEIRKMLSWLEREKAFDLVNIPFTLLIGLAKPLRDALGVPVVCTLQGEDLFLDNLQEPWKSESMSLIRQAVGDVDGYLAVSHYYQHFMSTYLGIPRERIRVVPLGITIDGHRPKPVRLEPPYTIGYFARIAPEKGLHVLVEAYRRLRQRPGVPPTKLLVAGYLLDEHRGYLKEIEARLRESGLAGEYRYAGAPDRAGKLTLLQEMDVFSVPAVYAEPKGLSLLEAMASGLPIVQPRRGAFTEIVERTGGGVLVAPDDPDALADALLALLTDRARAGALGTRGAEGVRNVYTKERMAEAAELACGEFLAARSTARPGARI